MLSDLLAKTPKPPEQKKQPGSEKKQPKGPEKTHIVQPLGQIFRPRTGNIPCQVACTQKLNELPEMDMQPRITSRQR